MSYSLLYFLPQPLRYSNIPVSVEAGQLLRVTENGQLAAQLRLKNCTGVPVTGATVGISLFGANGERLGGFSYVYSAYAAPNAEFGQAETVALRDCPAVSFAVEPLRVSFADGRIWEPSGSPVPIPAAPQQSLAGQGKRRVFPLIFAVVALLLYFGSLCYNYTLYQDHYAFSYYLGMMIRPTKVFLLLLSLVFPVLCLALTPKVKSACKPLGIVCLALGGLQVLCSALLLIFLLYQLPVTSLSFLSAVPGSGIFLRINRMLATHVWFGDIAALAAEGCLIAKNFITGAAFLKAAR